MRDGMKRRGVVLAFLMRLKQICNHPSQWLGDGAWSESDSGKLARLREIAEVIAAKQEKVLVFTQFREMTAPLAAFLGSVFGRPGLVLHGETAVKKRKELVRQFQEDERVPFFVLSLKAGGTGLNLTAASHVVHFDRWWNPAVENQATDRAFRIGQTKNVLVHKFVCRGTVEEKIDQLIESKRQLSQDLLEGGGEMLLTEMKDDELLKLVALDLHTASEEMRMAITTTMRLQALCLGRRRRRQAAREMAKLAEEGPHDLAGGDRGPHDRQDVLGQGVVRQPRTLQRLREPAAARPDLRAQRLGGRSADRAGRVTALVSGSRLYEVKVKVGAGAARRAGKPSAATARARSIRSSSCCRDASPRASWTRLCEEKTGLFPSPTEIRFRAVVPDWASMCKHVAAVLYGIGARLDRSARAALHAPQGRSAGLDCAGRLRSRADAEGASWRARCSRATISRRCSASK